MLALSTTCYAWVYILV